MEVFSFQWLNLSLWLVAACIGLTCAYGVDSNAAKVNGTDGSAAEAVAYDSLVRIGWPLALSWVVFACEKGYGGWLNCISPKKCQSVASPLSLQAWSTSSLRGRRLAP